MKATVDDEVIAESGDIVEVGGYALLSGRKRVDALPRKGPEE
jgi:hypothetical protein